MKKRTRYNEYKSRALRTVYSSGGISRTRLGQSLDVRLATITEIGRELLSEGLLKETGKVRNPRGVGKNETLLAIRPEGKYFIGCELFPEKIAVKFLNLQGHTVFEKIIKLSEKDKFDILDRIISEIEKEIKKLKIGRAGIYGLGFVDPGIIDVERGYSVFSTIMPEWKDVPTRNYLSKKLALPVFMLGTSQARALAECLFGSGRGVSNFLFIEYSKGIACGMVSEGRLVRGKNELAGEFGHFRFINRDELCNCGRKGCLEAIAGAPALEEKARKASASGNGKILKKLSGADPERINMEMLVEAAARGDRDSLEILDGASGLISTAVSNLIHALDPAKVIFDSSFLVFGREFMDDLFERIRKEVIFPGKIEFEISKIDSLEGALGGAGLALHEFLGLGVTHV